MILQSIFGQTYLIITLVEQYFNKKVLQEKKLIFFIFSWQVYVVGPQMSLFGPDISIAWVKFNNFRVYGTFLVMIMGTIGELT